MEETLGIFEVEEEVEDDGDDDSDDFDDEDLQFAEAEYDDEEAIDTLNASLSDVQDLNDWIKTQQREFQQLHSNFAFLIQQPTDQHRPINIINPQSQHRVEGETPFRQG